MNKTRIIGTLFGILSAVSFGLIPTIASFAYAKGVQVNTLLFLRFGIGCLILWLYIFIRKIPYNINLNQFKHIFLMSVFGYTVTSTTFFYSFKYISTSLSTIILYSYPIIVVIYEMISFKDYDKKKIYCLILTITGLFLILGIGTGIKLNVLGILLASISALAYAYFCIGAEQKHIKEINAIVLTVYVMSICSILYFIQCFITKEPILSSNPNSYVYIFTLSIVCGILPILTLAIAIKMIGAGNTAIIGTFEPLFACVLGVLVLHEKLTQNMILGGFMIISAVMLLQIFEIKKEKEPEYK